jgi:hypothetical protein
MSTDPHTANDESGVSRSRPVHSSALAHASSEALIEVHLRLYGLDAGAKRRTGRAGNIEDVPTALEGDPDFSDLLDAMRALVRNIPQERHKRGVAASAHPPVSSSS